MTKGKFIGSEKRVRYVDGCIEIVAQVKNRAMTESEAMRVVFGDLSHLGHTEAARELGLNYGQVYSVRYGDTFKKKLAKVNTELTSVSRVVLSNMIK